MTSFRVLQIIGTPTYVFTPKVPAIMQISKDTAKDFEQKSQNALLISICNSLFANFFRKIIYEEKEEFLTPIFVLRQAQDAVH